MPLVRWDPFREIDEIQREMNRMFDRLMARPTEADAFAFVPAVEMHDDPETITLKLELPGLNPNDLDIQATAESISISGERRFEKRSEDKGVTRTEFRYGRFQRVIPLPNRIKHDQVKAEYKDGILTLTLPKADSEKAHVVKVNVVS
ncbi:Hsp20/alpha crystallin family protein [Synechococcus sp. H65.1]|uniref:Hsp20/alpha crystallin family protein n=1 Tax=unclassified Synechococcus TaxID=2626047 RepID=UPI0039C208AD